MRDEAGPPLRAVVERKEGPPWVVRQDNFSQRGCPM
jgi:hypothetical protein